MQMPYLTMLTGLAVAEAIEQVAVVKADLKWPNDVQIQGRKVAGILVESGVARSKTFAVIGIGLNVNLAITSCPDIAAIATSLSDETGHPIDAMAVLRAQVSAIETMYLDVSPDIIFERWQKRLVTIGSRVRAAGINTAIKGLATGVTKEGSLVVRSEEGIEHIIIAGDVTLRQP
jgi:BirA family biotin operon repressor/biotin-[acetyl-CoA-carboxylase] ligase